MQPDWHDPKYEKFRGERHDAVKFVAAANIMRRHLTKGERSDAAAAIATLEASRPKSAHQCALSQEKAAELFGVSRRAVQDAKAVADSDD